MPIIYSYAYYLRRDLFSIRSIIFYCVLVCTFSYDLYAQATSDQKIRQEVAEDMAQHLHKHVIHPWYPRILDEDDGGFLSDYDASWQPTGEQDKMIVTQARHVWTPSRLARTLDEKEKYLKIAQHGARFLREKMWDRENGGFYNLVDKRGSATNPDATRGFIKTAYGNAFAIYGLAAHHRVSGSKESLDLAKEAFMWLEKNSHDAEFGGYFQFILEDGTPLFEGHENPPKDQNSSIHLIEAFCELYHVWKDPLVRERIEEMLIIIRDTITTHKGYMNLFFDRQWNPVSFRDATEAEREAGYTWDHVSFGHDIETAYLLQEAAESIYGEIDETTMAKTKKMVDHCLKWGWDEKHTGLLDRGYYFEEDGECKIIEDAKVWWAQVETMNTLLIMADLYPNDNWNYFDKFLMQWKYIKDNLIDYKNMGVYSAGLDTKPESINGKKASIWKGNYHTARSLINCIERLDSK